MHRYFLKSLLLFFVLFSSCSTTSSLKKTETDQSNSSLYGRSYDILALAYFQRAQEVKALQYQAYNLATDRLKEILKKGNNLNPAVVLDIDETVLDNSPASVQSALRSTYYPTGWNEWVDQARAKIIPGAKEFIQFAIAKKVKVLFVSNRETKQLAATIKNLSDLGLTFQESDFFLREDTSSKEKRRQIIKSKFTTVLLIGDNLNDFTGVFDKKLSDERTQLTVENKEEFGRKFIVLPNPLYGDWEGALYDYKFPKTAKEREEILKKSLNE